MNGPTTVLNHAVKGSVYNRWAGREKMSRKRPLKLKTGLGFICPSCDHITFAEFGANEICPLCFWEDDGVDIDTPYKESSANGCLSLITARTNFKAFGACSERWKSKVLSANESQLFERVDRSRIFLIFQLLESLRELGILVAEHGIAWDGEFIAAKEVWSSDVELQRIVCCDIFPIGVNSYGGCQSLWIRSKLATLPMFRQLVLDKASDFGLRLTIESRDSIDSWRQEKYDVIDNC